jgi:carbamoyltransferase
MSHSNLIGGYRTGSGTTTRGSVAAAPLTAGLGGATSHACVALIEEQQVIGVCEQERITRVKGAGFNSSGLPDEAIDTLLDRLGRRRDAIERFAVAELGHEAAHASLAVEALDHHFAHACASYLTSPFSSATIVVCDHEEPKVSVWQGRGAEVTRVDWPWRGPGFADLYSLCAQTLGLTSADGGQRFEALARLQAGRRDDRLTALLRVTETGLELEPDWQSTVLSFLPTTVRPGTPEAAPLTSALQERVGELFIEWLRAVQQRTGGDALCLGGSFFYHSSITSLAKQAGLFRRVFVPVNPGNAGLAVGAGLRVSGAAPRLVSPFLGPAYSQDEIKATLDNCKLRYDWVHTGDCIALAVDSVRRGMLVGWFDGAMEWGPRALGARCILANPFAPFVLENLNRFLKRRDRWRGYALSGPAEAVPAHFTGPDGAPFMECDFRPLDRERFRHILPSPEAAIRCQTVGADCLPRFRRLLEAFGAVEGLPFLDNTSFNGFHEPIVCSPRDAVRVFYGSGLDVLILDQFVVMK